MNNPDRLPFLETMKMLQPFNPVKLCFNNKELFNNYNPTEKNSPSLNGETKKYLEVVRERIDTKLETHDIWVNKIEILPLKNNRSLVYLTGTVIAKGYFDENTDN